MDWRKKVGLAMVIVGVGLAAALQFRKLQSHEPSGAASSWSSSRALLEPAFDPKAQTRREPQSRSHTEGSAPAAFGSLDVAGNPGVAPSSMPTFAGRIELTNDSAVGDTSVAGRSKDAHDASSGVKPSPSTATPAAPSTADLFARFADADRQRSASRDSNLSSGLIDLNAPHQMHTIVDGDTLTALAERYLGDAKRFAELYQFNRDVLHSPDLLPIGAELRIPSAIPVQPSTDDAAAMNPSAAPLQPVPAAPASAKGTAPASAQRAAPRTYTVQVGDNLVDVARKLYGDGRRHEQLYEANRRVMRNPADLRPGMVLAVP